MRFAAAGFECPINLVMSAGCPHKHLSYARWRLQLFRGLFCPSVSQSTAQGEAGGILHPPNRPGNRRNFSTSSTGPGLQLPRRKRESFTEELDPSALLEEAAKRTTLPQNIDPSLSLRKEPSQGGTKALTSDASYQKKRARAAPRTRKQIEEEAAASFLEEATKRVTGRLPSELPRAPASPPDSVTSSEGSFADGPETISRPGSRVGVPFGGTIRRLINNVERVAFQDRARAESPGEELQSWFREALEREKRHEQRLKVLGLNPNPYYAPRPPSPAELQPPMPKKALRLMKPWKYQVLKRGHSAGRQETTWAEQDAPQSEPQEPEPRKPISKDSRNLDIHQKIVSGTCFADADDRKPDEPLTASVDDGTADLSQRSKKVHDTSASNSEIVVSTSSDSEVSSLQDSPMTIDENMAASSNESDNSIFRGSPTKASNDIPSVLKILEPSGSQGSSITTGEDTPFMSNGSEESSFEDSSTNVTEHGPSKHNGSEGSISEDPSLDSSENTLPNFTSEKATTKPDPTVEKRSRGILSTYEHEQLSALLSSLQSIPKQRVDVMSPAPNLPSSPYQRLQFNERRMKEQAKARAKQRLQDNPWAQLLASPIRMCQATGVRLPTKLMVGWNYVRNPKDNQIYLMPEELTDMTHLSAFNRTGSLAGRNSDEKMLQGTKLSGSEVDPSIEEAPAMDRSTTSLQSAGPLKEQEEGNNSEKSPPSEASPNATKRKPPIAPAKLHMRPSSILLMELNQRMLDVRELRPMADDARPVRIKTNLNAVNRLLTHRWKEQARRFEKSTELENSQAGFLTTQEMREVQWYPNIHNVMLDLLRSRVLKALEGVAIRNSRKSGIHRRIIPMPLAKSDSLDESSVTTTLSGIDQAVFLWLGSENSSSSTTHRSCSSPPSSPSARLDFTLRFVPKKSPAESDSSSSSSSPPDTDQNKPEDAFFIPLWTHNLPSPKAAETTQHQTAQQLYAPPSISLHLPISNTTTSPSNNPTTHTSHHLPIFDLPHLLAESHLSKFRTLAHTNPDVREAFGLPAADQAIHGPAGCGWVMVKGGKWTAGFKELVQEVWRLWMFVGGRRGG